MAEMLLNQLKSRSSNGLEDAVKQCVTAASKEDDPSTQKILLKVNKRQITSLNLQKNNK